MECVVQGIIETQVRSFFVVSESSRRIFLRFASDFICVIQYFQHVEALEILLQGLCGVQRQRLRVVPTAAAALMSDGGTTL